MIDLHMHSNFSDGSFSPTQLVQRAKELGLSAIALTDHDTIDGIPEFLEAGEKLGVATVPGVEISVDTPLPNHGHMHILGLFINSDSEKLKNTLHFLLTQRNLRAKKIVDKLVSLSVPITMEELKKEAGEGAIGRPHVAQIMVRKGYVQNISEAFEVYLKKGKPAYMDKVKLGEAEALKMVKDANGLAILAHPQLMNYNSFEETREKILSLSKLGLDGFEVYYSGMPTEYTTKLLELAQENDFAVSGGSDFHGANKDHIKMGSGLGNLSVPDRLLSELREKWRKKAAQSTAAN